MCSRGKQAVADRNQKSGLSGYMFLREKTSGNTATFCRTGGILVYPQPLNK
jgi:hypothetical protein